MDDFRKIIRKILKISSFAVRVTVPLVVVAVSYVPPSVYLPVPLENFPKPIQEIALNLEPEITSAHVDDVFIFLTVASASALNKTWTVPADWNSASNSIEVIGGGGGGGKDAAEGPGGGGGGGYSRINNLTLTPGATVHFNVGASGSAATADPGDGFAGSHSYFNAANFAACTDNTVCVKAEGGEGGKDASPFSYDGGAGGNFGSTASAVGTTTKAGGTGGLGCAGDAGGGGGGAGGPNGDGTGNIGGAGGGDSTPGVGGGGGGAGGGSDGLQGSVACGTASGGQTGGDGGNNYLGTGGATDSTAANPGTSGGGGVGGNDGVAGGAGGDGDDWVTGYGSGGGGGGGGDGFAGGNGGKYGGGGGGGEVNGGRGADGIIVIKYTARAVQSHFQWFNDDYALDSMDNLASISAEDIKASGSEALAINDTSRLRIQVANIKGYGEVAFSADKFRLEMARAGTSCTSLASGWDWRTVPLDGTGIASAAFDIEDSGQSFADGASTSVSLLSTPSGAVTFTNGYALDQRATTGYQTIADNAFTEIEWTIKPNSNANTSADYCFRAGWITDPSTTPDTRSSMSYSKIASASVQAAQSPTFTQNDYEWFYDNDLITPTGSIAGVENTYAGIGTTTIIPRLRMNYTVGTATLTAGSAQFKLQHAVSSNGPWTDVGTGAWIFRNTSVADDADIADSGTLVSTSENAARQTYNENNPSATNPRAVSVGSDAEYDWALDPANVVSGVIYYFRMIKSTDAVLDAYNSDSYPSIRVQLNVDYPGAPGFSNAGGGGSGGGAGQSGGGSGGGAGGSGGEGESGGGQGESGGGQGGGGGGSPVMFDWSWLFGNVSLANESNIMRLLMSAVLSLLVIVWIFIERRISK